MGIYAIVWDVGGVLERTEDPAPRKELSERLGVDIPSLSHLIFGHSDNFRVQLGEISVAAHWENVRQELGISVEEFPQIIEAFFGGDEMDYKLVDYIRSLKANYHTAILSNYMPTLRDKVTVTLNHFNMIHRNPGLIRQEFGMHGFVPLAVRLRPDEDLHTTTLVKHHFRAFARIAQNTFDIVTKAETALLSLRLALGPAFFKARNIGKPLGMGQNA